MLPDPIVCGVGLHEGEAEVAAGVRGWRREQKRWSRRQVHAGKRTADSAEALMAATVQWEVFEEQRARRDTGATGCAGIDWWRRFFDREKWGDFGGGGGGGRSRAEPWCTIVDAYNRFI
jgi:hypothetical protein